MCGFCGVPRTKEQKKTRIERDTCTPMFIAVLFIIARTLKQPRCPSADEWIRKQCYIYKMEYYSAIKKNTFESVLMRWMKLEPIIQSEVSQGKKHHPKPNRVDMYKLYDLATSLCCQRVPSLEIFSLIPWLRWWYLLSFSTVTLLFLLLPE